MQQITRKQAIVTAILSSYEEGVAMWITWELHIKSRERKLKHFSMFSFEVEDGDLEETREWAIQNRGKTQQQKKTPESPRF